jgi:hypothetical protein
VTLPERYRTVSAEGDRRFLEEVLAAVEAAKGSNNERAWGLLSEVASRIRRRLLLDLPPA